MLQSFGHATYGCFEENEGSSNQGTASFDLHHSDLSEFLCECEMMTLA